MMPETKKKRQVIERKQVNLSGFFITLENHGAKDIRVSVFDREEKALKIHWLRFNTISEADGEPFAF